MTLPLPTPDDLDFNEAGHIMLPETLQHQPGIIRTSTGTRDQKLVIDIPVRTLLGWNGHWGCLADTSVSIWLCLLHLEENFSSLVVHAQVHHPQAIETHQTWKTNGETNGSCYIFWRIAGYFSSPQRQQTHNNSSMNSPRLSETTYPAPFLSSWELNKTRKWGNSLKCAQQFWGKVVFLVAVY